MCLIIKCQCKEKLLNGHYQGLFAITEMWDGKGNSDINVFRKVCALSRFAPVSSNIVKHLPAKVLLTNSARFREFSTSEVSAKRIQHFHSPLTLQNYKRVGALLSDVNK